MRSLNGSEIARRQSSRQGAFLETRPHRWPSRRVIAAIGKNAIRDGQEKAPTSGLAGPFLCSDGVMEAQPSSNPRGQLSADWGESRVM
jgi:hypothetical protein